MILRTIHYSDTSKDTLILTEEYLSINNNIRKSSK